MGLDIPSNSPLLECLAGPGQGKWQGPALYVHNDATFSPEDFKSISKIGQEGKLDKANATGKMLQSDPFVNAAWFVASLIGDKMHLVLTASSKL